MAKSPGVVIKKPSTKPDEPIEDDWTDDEPNNSEEVKAPIDVGAGTPINKVPGKYRKLL